MEGLRMETPEETHMKWLDSLLEEGSIQLSIYKGSQFTKFLSTLDLYWSYTVEECDISMSKVELLGGHE